MSATSLGSTTASWNTTGPSQSLELDFTAAQPVDRVKVTPNATFDHVQYYDGSGWTNVANQSVTHESGYDLVTFTTVTTDQIRLWWEPSSTPGNSTTTLEAFGPDTAAYAYDAAGRRIITDSGTATHLYYSDQWQVLEEQLTTDNGPLTASQYVWSPVYVDAMIERDRDTDANGSLDERLYAQTDANYNVTALVDTTGAVVQRFVEDPYGNVTFLTTNYQLSTNNYAWSYLHQGGRFDEVSGLYYFRNRDHSAWLGRWMEEDPAGHVDGMGLYQYLAGGPVARQDPLGLSVSDVKLGEDELLRLRDMILSKLMSDGGGALGQKGGTLRERAAYYCAKQLTLAAVKNLSLDIATAVMERGLIGLRGAKVLYGLDTVVDKVTGTIRLGKGLEEYTESELSAILSRHQTRMYTQEVSADKLLIWRQAPARACSCTLVVDWNMDNYLVNGYIEGSVGDRVEREGASNGNPQPFFLPFSAGAKLKLHQPRPTPWSGPWPVLTGIGMYNWEVLSLINWKC